MKTTTLFRVMSRVLVLAVLAAILPSCANKQPPKEERSPVSPDWPPFFRHHRH